MNISITGGSSSAKSNSIFAGQSRLLQGTTRKSTQEKAQRQQKANDQIAFWENQKENLKNKECDTLEEIAEKLELFHDYEAEISAVKNAYNYEQMHHVLDEAEELGEKIAKAAEKLEHKTPEERRQDQMEEALGTDENKGMLEEMLEETADLQEETADTLEETKDTLEKSEEALEKTTDILEESEEALEEPTEMSPKPTDLGSVYDVYRVSKGKEWERLYPGVDIKI